MIDLLGPASFDGAVTTRPADGRSYGLADTWFRDCSDPALDDGTEFGAAWFNQVLANMRSIARGNGQTAAAADVVTQDNGNDALLWNALQHMFQRQQPIYADDVGNNALQVVVTLSPAPAELKRGMSVRIKIANNIATSASLTVNGIPKAIKTVSGEDIKAGMILAGQMADFDYDGTAWQLVSASSAPSLPKARLLTSAIGSLPFATWNAHNLTLAASAVLAPVMGGASFTLPLAGTYLFVLSGGGTVTTTAATNTGGAMGVFKNGVLADSGGVTTYLPTAANQTFKYQLATVIPIVATDVISFATQSSATSSSHYGTATGNAGFVDLVRLGP